MISDVPELYIKIEEKYKDSAKLPTKIRSTDAGWDLYAVENIIIEPHSFSLVPIGIRIAVSKGYYYTVVPRSSLGFKKSIYPNFNPVFDHGWTGNMDIKMYNLSDDYYLIEKGDKFAQLLVHKVETPILINCSDKQWESITKDFERKENGWGSSGK